MRTDQVAHIFCRVLTPQVRRLVSVLRVPGRSIGPVLGLIATLVPLPFLSGLLPIVHFVRERIDIAVYPEEVRVEGLYVYRNP